MRVFVRGFVSVFFFFFGGGGKNNKYVCIQMKEKSKAKQWGTGKNRSVTGLCCRF